MNFGALPIAMDQWDKFIILAVPHIAYESVEPGNEDLTLSSKVCPM